MTTAEAPTGIESLWEAIQYTPTPTQAAILKDTSRFQLVAGGFRGGKSQTAGVKGATGTMTFIAKYGEQAAGKVAWLVSQDYEMVRAEFNYITEILQTAWPGVKATSRVDPGYIRIPVPKDDNPQQVAGFFEIKTKSANDPSTLGMEAPVFIIVCEAARVSVDVYERLVSRTSEARQRFPDFGWMHMEGTFEGSLGWYPSLWQKWRSPAAQQEMDARSFSLPTHSNTHLYPGGENDPEILHLQATLPEDKYRERHLGEPVPPSGRVHTAFDPLIHVRKVKYNPDLPVYIGIDPGYSGQPSTYAVVAAHLISFEDGFQQWQVFDEIAINKHAMPGFTVKDVCEIAMQKWWWQNPDKKATIDVAGETHAGAQESNAEVWMKVTGLVLYAGRVNIQPGIDRFDTTLKQHPVSREPGILIDPRCSLFISELGGGPNPFDGQTHVYSWLTNKQNEVVGKTPKDAYCDAIKAFTYMDYHTRGAAYANNSRANIRVRSRRSRRRRSRETVRM